MTHINKVTVYCVADEGIDATSAHIKMFNLLGQWEEVFGTVVRKEVNCVGEVQATLYPALRSDGPFHKKPRAKNAQKAPAPYTVSQHELTITSRRKQQGMVLVFFLGPTASAAFDVDDYMDVGESAMMNMNDTVATLEQLASDSDGIEGLVYDMMQHAAFWPDNEFEQSDYVQSEEEQAVMVAYYE